MVNKNQSKVSTLRSKLVAAIAMLLVGAFMVVSSSYAWFTLSTAPEVTGIHTSVGANGNLEMALVPAEGVTAITDGVGQTGINTAWGNLVDLEQADYGLDKISLKPSRLTYAPAGDESDYDYTFTGLNAPVYGADGRIASLAGSVTGMYNASSWTADTEAKGVVAYGTASGMSAQQTAWMQYKKNVNANLAEAQVFADGTLEKHGRAMAEMIMQRALNGESGKFDITYVGPMLTDLEQAVALLPTAMKNYFAAKAAETLYNVDDSTWSSIALEIEALNFATMERDTTSVTIAGTPVPFDSTLTAAFAQYNEIKTKIANARTAWNAYAIDGVDTTKASWTDNIKPILLDTGLLVYDEITINGKTTEDIKKLMYGEDLQGTFDPSNPPAALVEFGMNFASNGIVDFTSGSGIHADFAEIVGEYQAEMDVTMEVKGISYTAKAVKLRAVIDADGNRVDMYAALSDQPDDNTNSSAVKPITDFYGYRLDFAFRTNALGSKLMLQTDATGRIYSTEGSDSTQGSGSSMTFEILDSSFNQSQAKSLMSAVRIVFLTEKVESNGDITREIVALGLLEQDVDNGTGYAYGANGEITSAIYLYNFSFDAEGELVVGNKIAATDGKTALMDLTQNQPTVLSALVYLDGDQVDNSDVAAEAVYSLTGSLNLQFSSDADLKPMDYAEFKGAGEETTTQNPAVQEPETQG